MKTRYILFIAFLAILISGGLVLGVVNQFSDDVTVAGDVTATGTVQGEQLTSTDDMAVSGLATVGETLGVTGAVTGGADGTAQGTLTLWDGAGGNTPAWVMLHSPDGTAGYLFLGDDGDFRAHTSAPTATTDGAAIGSGAGGGTMDMWILTDGANPQIIDDGESVTVAGGNGISGVTSATNTMTYSLGTLGANWTQNGAYDIALANADSELRIMEDTGATWYGVLDVGNLTAERWYTFGNEAGDVIVVPGAGGTAGQRIIADGDETYSYKSPDDWIWILTAEGGSAPDISGAADAALDADGNVTRAFDPDADEVLYWSNTFIPANWAGGTVDVTIVFRVASDWTDVTDKVDWEISGYAISASDASSSAHSFTTVTRTWATDETTGDDIHVTSSAYTIGGTPADRDRVKWALNRDANDAVNDTCGADAELLMVIIELGVN